jgi:hypothetical protein
MAQIRDAYDEVWSENLARRGNTWEQNIKTCVSVWVALRRLQVGSVLGEVLRCCTGGEQFVDCLTAVGTAARSNWVALV